MALNKNVAKGIKTRQGNELRENNKLIAEFMGVVFHDDENQYYDNNGLYIGEELKYHALWDDWLMPVVEKILDISFQDEGDAEDFYSIRDCIPDRNHTYKAVVEFIKEYNKNKEE